MALWVVVVVPPWPVFFLISELSTAIKQLRRCKDSKNYIYTYLIPAGLTRRSLGLSIQFDHPAKSNRALVTGQPSKQGSKYQPRPAFHHVGDYCGLEPHFRKGASCSILFFHQDHVFYFQPYRPFHQPYRTFFFLFSHTDLIPG
jgi:hypothetical protein